MVVGGPPALGSPAHRGTGVGGALGRVAGAAGRDEDALR